MSAPHGMGQTAALYNAVGQLCDLFKSYPDLHARSIVIHENGRIEVNADGVHGVLRDWSRALPDHTPRSGLAPAFYGSAEADVLEQGGLTVTIRRPLLGPGGF
jgi:hypothetical protein